MSQLAELAGRLTPAEALVVEAYAASLVARRPTQSSTDAGRPNRIKLDELDEMLVRMTDDMPWPEIKKRIRNDYADAAED